jgi:transcriptional antiterminator NusG
MSSCGANWFAVWTHSHCELRVQHQLEAKGFHTLLPMLRVWSRRGGSRRLGCVPMFPGYLLLRHAMDKAAYVEILKTSGLVRILGERWDRLSVIPNEEVDAIHRVVDGDVPVSPHPFLHDGERVRIIAGPLIDVTGILVEVKPNRGHVVLSVGLLQRSVAVEVDCMHVEPIGTSRSAS